MFGKGFFMIDYDKLQEIIAEYKQNFEKHWINEKYKWIAVKHFQDNWDINAPNFVEMFSKATEKTRNLLHSGMFFPRLMLIEYAKVEPETIRLMFKNLFDEKCSVIERITQFNRGMDELKQRISPSKNHFNDVKAISTYLWLKYPEQYYIYKYTTVSKIIKTLAPSIPFKRGSDSSVNVAFDVYNKITDYIKKDNELTSILRDNLTEDCYSDTQFKTLTSDVVFYISEHFINRNEWFPINYSPNFSKQDWINLLKDKTIFDNDDLAIMKRFKDFGGAATCSQLANKYGETPGFYNVKSSKLAHRIADATNCSTFNDDENSKWWPILYLGKKADKDIQGNFIWKLRDELSEALNDIDLTNINLYTKDNNMKKDEKNVRYWWLNANPKIWSFSDINVGEEQHYTLYNESGNKRRIFEYFKSAKAGDLIIGYESTPIKKIVALAEVARDTDENYFYFKKTRDLSEPIDYESLKDIPELSNMEYLKSAQGSLFKLTENEYFKIIEMTEDDNSNPIVIPSKVDSYTSKDFLNKVFINEEEYNRLKNLLKYKQNVILQGAPGVGKTFMAKRLAYSILGSKQNNYIECVQFHQSYSYEDFIMGYKPTNNGFELKTGIFYNFCKKAEKDLEHDYFFIIDEINRGNLSKIFGELLMLIEKDKRGSEYAIKLAYSDEKFYIPKNLYIIGMMNTADRSLAIMDYALRRRFSFYYVKPAFNVESFSKHLRENGISTELINQIKEKFNDLNNYITDEAKSNLGKGFCIGHSYFCCKPNDGQSENDWYDCILNFEINELLQEYWWDEKLKAEDWINRLKIAK